MGYVKKDGMAYDWSSFFGFAVHLLRYSRTKIWNNLFRHIHTQRKPDVELLRNDMSVINE